MVAYVPVKDPRELCEQEDLSMLVNIKPNVAETHTVKAMDLVEKEVPATSKFLFLFRPLICSAVGSAPPRDTPVSPRHQRR